MGNTLLLGLLASFMCAGYGPVQVKVKPLPDKGEPVAEVSDQPAPKEERAVVDE